MTPTEQLEYWVKGVNVHNEERDECCPDFACCGTSSPMSIPERLEFQRRYLAGDQEYVMSALLGRLKLLRTVF